MHERIILRAVLCALLASLVACNDGRSDLASTTTTSSASDSAAGIAAETRAASGAVIESVRATAAVALAPQTGLALACVGATSYKQAAACQTHEYAPLQPGLYFESYPTVVASWSYTDPNYGYRLESSITPKMGVIVCPIAVVPYQTFTGNDPCGPTSHSMVAASTLGIGTGSSAGGSSASSSSSGSGSSSVSSSSSGSSSGVKSTGSSSGSTTAGSSSGGGTSVVQSASGSSASGSSSGASSSSSGSSSSSSSSGGTGPAARLAAKLGAPSRLLLGEEEQASNNDIAAWESLGLPHPDIYQRYLTGMGWTSWDSPAGSYTTIVMKTAGAAGAIPFFTLYQISGDISTIASEGRMATYWANYKLLLQLIAAYGKPVLINFEPDGWGFMEQQNQNAALVFAYVDNNPDCATEPNTAVGMGQCLLSMRNKYAPNAYVGFSYSNWAGKAAQVTSFMQQVGAGQADFIVGGTLDVSAGCLEAYAWEPSGCKRGPEGQTVYWDETNTTHPNFLDAFSYITAYQSGIGGNLPIIWWQTPVGAPSSTPGGTPNHYRDNRVDYFLKHPGQLTAIGTLAVSFAGQPGDTNILTDGGEFKALAGAYFAAPTPLP
jgi:hypothetical protein